MESMKVAGRVVGLLLLLHLAIGLMAPFILLDQVRGSAGLLANAAGSPIEFRAAVLLLFAGSGMAIAATVAAWPVLRPCSQPTAPALFALAVAGFSLQAVDNGALMAILALSQEHASTAGPAGVHETLAAVVGGGRRWLHYSYLAIAVGWIFLLSCSFFRFRLVPRVLAALCAATSLLQVAGVSAPALLLGAPPVTALAVPLAPAYLALALWLLARGFAESARVSGEGSRAPSY